MTAISRLEASLRLCTQLTWVLGNDFQPPEGVGVRNFISILNGTPDLFYLQLRLLKLLHMRYMRYPRTYFECSIHAFWTFLVYHGIPVFVVCSRCFGPVTNQHSCRYGSRDFRMPGLESLARCGSFGGKGCQVQACFGFRKTWSAALC